MLQCQRCQQWFHQECIRNPKIPQLLWGDRFWNFVCTICSGTTQEIVEKLPMGWVNALHLILFNLIGNVQLIFHKKIMKFLVDLEFFLHAWKNRNLFLFFFLIGFSKSILMTKN